MTLSFTCRHLSDAYRTFVKALGASSYGNAEGSGKTPVLERTSSGASSTSEKKKSFFKRSISSKSK